MTKNAEELVALICREHKLQLDRVAGGHINADQVQVCLRERLIAIGKRDDKVRRLLSDVGPIPKADDECPLKPWADDPREERAHTVQSVRDTNSNLPTTALSRTLIEDEVDFPMPGERVC